MAKNQIECNLCKNTTSFDTDEKICKFCGYDSESKTIRDTDTCKQHYQKLNSKRDNWVETVTFLGGLKALKKYSNINIGKLLGVSRSTICQDLQLFKSLEEKPELKSITSKGTAFKRRNKITSTKAFDTEEILHRNLYHNWDKTPFAKKWELVKTDSYYGKFNTNEIGEMDMLAKNKAGDKWLVIELKKDQGSDATIGQILRYMGWLKTNKTEKNQTVKGLVVCGNYNDKMAYALNCLPDIDAYIYRLHNNEIKFLPYKDGYAKVYNNLEGLGIDHKTMEKVLRDLNESSSK